MKCHKDKVDASGQPWRRVYFWKDFKRSERETLKKAQTVVCTHNFYETTRDKGGPLISFSLFSSPRWVELRGGCSSGKIQKNRKVVISREEKIRSHVSNGIIKSFNHC